MAAELVVVNGSSAGTRHDLTKGEFFIGRSPSSKIVINEPEVGWRHCQIRQHERPLSDHRSSKFDRNLRERNAICGALACPIATRSGSAKPS